MKKIFVLMIVGILSLPAFTVRVRAVATPYVDEQIALMFATLKPPFSANTWDLCWSVTLVQQVDADGYGPAYLLNGVTDVGWWYQAGISYNYYTMRTGFQFAYQIYDNNGNPKDNFVQQPISFNGPVNAGDNIQLSVYYNAGSVHMLAIDGNTHAVAEKIYDAHGGTHFVSTGPQGDANGYFTGLMTEWKHLNAYTQGEQMVVYKNIDGQWLTSAYMCIAEKDTSSGKFIIYPSNSGLVTYTNPTLGQYFSNTNAMAASNAYVFITGTYTPKQVTCLAPSGWGMDINSPPHHCTSFVQYGVPPYTYQWCVDGAAVSGATSSDFYYSPSSTGTHAIYFEAFDAVGIGTLASAIYAYVNPAPSVSISPTSVTMDVGQSKTFTATASSGTPYYNNNVPTYCYYWSYNTSAILAIVWAMKHPVASSLWTATGSWTFTPPSSGTWYVACYVVDWVNGVAASVATVTVHSAPSVSISPTSVTMHVGQSQTFTATASGGTPAYSYYWGSGTSLLLAIVNAARYGGPTSSTTWTFTPSASGSYLVAVIVVDSVGGQTSSSASVTVNP